jgi:hypothetical protein
VFVFGVDATRTPAEDDIRKEADPARLDDDEYSGSGALTDAVPMYVGFVVKPKLASTLVAAVVADTTVLLPEVSINDGNGGRADC